VTEKRPGEPDVVHLVEVKDKEFRAWAKHKLLSNSQTAGYNLEITGSLQNYAKGIELHTYLHKASAAEIQSQAKGIIHSYIDALTVLCERGFVHGDLKGPNAFYDPTSQKISLIDTGGLAKISKDRSRHENTKFNYLRAFTPHYSAPALLRKKNVGFEQDMFSVGVQMLDIIGKTKYPNASKCAKIRDELRASYDQVLARKKPLIVAQQEMLALAFQGLASININPIQTEHEELEVTALLSIIVPLHTKNSLDNRDGQMRILKLLQTNPSHAAQKLKARGMF
jgi:serine/threonine protein kinase